MRFHNIMFVWVVVSLGLLMVSGAALAEEEQSVDEVAKELSNPIGSLASLNASFLYQTFKGDLPNAGSQDAWQFQFQPVFPFPLSNGYNLLVRPLVPVFLDQPVFDPAKLEFDDRGPDLGDISGDIAYGRTDTEKGLLYFGGLFFSAPTTTDDDLATDQWRLGPEAAFGFIGKWGVAGALVFHQWNLNDTQAPNTSLTSAQYFYAFGLGKGWQITSSPILSYDWHADSDDAWTVPIGIGTAKTTKIGKTPWKFKLESQYYVEQPDPFGPEWLFKLTITPVIKNPFIF